MKKRIMNMEKIELLERHYNAFINLTNTRDFFIGMADYFEFADSTKEFEIIMDGLLAQAKKKREKLDAIGEEVVVICDGMKGEIEEYVKMHKIESEIILNKFDFYNQLKDGRGRSSAGVPVASHQCIEAVIIAINQFPEHLEFVKKYAEMVIVDQRPMVNRLIPFKEYEEYRELNAEIDREEKTTLWGQLERISHLYGALKRGREEINKLMKSHKEEPSPNKSWKILNYGILVEEWIEIEEDRQNHNLYFFKVDEVKPWLTRIHNHLISRAISPTSAQKSGKSGLVKIFISKDKGVYIDNNKVYPVKGKKRPSLIWKLQDGKKDAAILCKTIPYETTSALSKEISEINKNFKEKLDLKCDLIIHKDTGGYALNQGELEVEFID